MKAVTLYTESAALHRRIELILAGCASVVRGTRGICAEGLVIIDRSTVTDEDITGIELPLGVISHEWLIRTVNEADLGNGKKIAYNPKTREVTVGDVKSVLTEVEYRLFSALVSRDGFTSREELSQTVWGEHESGLLNVYIHYLREKLEHSGERVIISSRKEGYKIDGKYERSALC